MTNTPASLRSVAVLELTKGLLVLIAGGVLAGVLPTELQADTEALVRHFHMNPGRHDPRALAEALRQVGDAQKLVLAIGALCYAAVRFVEAYGLWHGRRWAWGFGVISAALYIPLELVELTKGLTWAGLVVLLINLVIVGLLWHGRGWTR